MFDRDLLKEILTDKEASIKAETDDNGGTSISLEGRAIDLLMISLAISERIIEKTPVTVDDYCKILKRICDTSKEEKQVQGAIMRKVFESILKD